MISIPHEPIFNLLGKTCLNRPAESLRCLPVSAVRPVLYANLHPDYSKFLLLIPFCFLRRRTAESYSLSGSIFKFTVFCRGQLALCTPRQAEPAWPHFAVRRINLLRYKKESDSV